MKDDKNAMGNDMKDATNDEIIVAMKNEINNAAKDAKNAMKNAMNDEI